MAEAAEKLRNRVIVNRVCRQVQPPQPLTDNRLRQRLARDEADLTAVTSAIVGRLMTEDQLRGQVRAAWEAAEADVASRSGDDLLAIAPGDEILNQVFMRFANRGYSKRNDGVAIARAMPAPPQEIRELLTTFMLDNDDEDSPPSSARGDT
jgi:hypothetical protein